MCVQIKGLAHAHMKCATDGARFTTAVRQFKDGCVGSSRNFAGWAGILVFSALSLPDLRLCVRSFSVFFRTQKLHYNALFTKFPPKHAL
jgi:hypothetical protein